MSIYYVYGHYLDNKLVYVGKGTNNRAWSGKRYNSDHQSWAHKQIMSNNWGNCVKILKSNLSSKEAYAEEKALIEELEPMWNSQSNKHHKCEHCGYVTETIQGLTSHKRNRHP